MRLIGVQSFGCAISYKQCLIFARIINKETRRRKKSQPEDGLAIQDNHLVDV